LSADLFTVRPAQAADSEIVFALLKQLASSHAPDPVAFDFTFAWLISAEATSSLLLVAEDSGGHVLGYALTTISPLLHVNGSSAQLQELVVDDAHQNQGVGTALVEATEAACRHRQVRQLTVPSRRSADFYERIGYTSTADFLKRTFA
jgi:GNAT superfamily N-acetyltransferase